MTRTKHISDYQPISEKIQTDGVEDMEFEEVLQKEHADILG